MKISGRNETFWNHPSPFSFIRTIPGDSLSDEEIRKRICGICRYVEIVVAIMISVRINFEVRFIKRVFNFEKNQRITWNS